MAAGYRNEVENEIKIRLRISNVLGIRIKIRTHCLPRVSRQDRETSVLAPDFSRD
jgi:hypothetical protein